MKTNSPLDEYRLSIEILVAAGLGPSAIVKELAKEGITTTESSIRRALKRWEHDPLDFSGDEATFDLPASTRMADPETVMKQWGLDPSEWEVRGLIINSWDSPAGETLYQTKFNLKRLTPLNMVFPARVDGYKPKKVKVKRDKKAPRLVVLCGDQQAPYHDERLHGIFCNWLEDNKPDEGVLIGDTMDLPSISRHADEPEWAASTQECVDSAYTILRDYVQASEQTAWQKLAGNHDERLRRSIIDRVRDLHDLRRADIGEEERSVFDPAYLLRLDELGIKYVAPKGGYNHAQIMLSPLLAARHGWIATRNSGASALKTLEHLGYSVVVGHTHRQSLVYKTKHDIYGDPETLAAAEIGCMCAVREGLGYAVHPDWQQGFTTATVWQDGKFRLEHATYVNGALFWRDQRY